MSNATAVASVASFRRRKKAVPRNHPDGGTIWIYPLDAIQQQKMRDHLQLLEYELDADGHIKLDEYQKPISRDWTGCDAERVAKQVTIIRENSVEKITNVVDADDPIDANGEAKLIELTEPAMIESFLAQKSERLVERDVALMILVDVEQRSPEGKTLFFTQEYRQAKNADETPKTVKREVPANELCFTWVMNEAAELGSSKQAATAKNSLSTPSDYSATQAP